MYAQLDIPNFALAAQVALALETNLIYRKGVPHELDQELLQRLGKLGRIIFRHLIGQGIAEPAGNLSPLLFPVASQTPFDAVFPPVRNADVQRPKKLVVNDVNTGVSRRLLNLFVLPLNADVAPIVVLRDGAPVV